jgi:uncharacterized SAM-binding protein YcdF (DUF218 family)
MSAAPLPWTRVLLAAAPPVALFVLVGLFHAPILGRVASWLHEVDELRPADVIVVMGGESGYRVARAAALYREGIAPRVVVTGADPEPDHFITPSWEEWLVLLTRAGVPEDSLVVLHPSESTYDDATLLRDHLLEAGLRSAVVITDPYHTRRSRWMIGRAFLGTDLSAAVVSSGARYFAPEAWWKDERQLFWVFSEYVKFAYYVASYGPSGDLPPHAAVIHRAPHE